MAELLGNFLYVGVIIFALLFAIGLVATMMEKFGKRKQGSPTLSANFGSGAADPASDPALASQKLNMLSGYLNRFDRDMYVDDMTADQLQHEYLYRTVYILVWWMSQGYGVNRDELTGEIASRVSGRVSDRQLIGLSEYYTDTVYEGMQAQGQDLYWSEDLAEKGNDLTEKQKMEILLGVFVTEAVWRRLTHSQSETGDNGTDQILNDCLSEFEQVAGRWFGDTASVMSGSLRQQADKIALTIRIDS